MPLSGVMNTAYASGAGMAPLANSVREVFSAEILYNALPLLRFEQFCARRTELNTQPGNTIRIQRSGSIKRGGQLQEGVHMRTQPMSSSYTSITVYEQGNAVSVSEFLALSSFYDVFMQASTLMGRDLALVLDIQLRDVLFQGTNVVFGGATAAANRAALTAVTHIFSTVPLKTAVETLEIANAPKFGGDHYVCALHPHQARGLRDDSAWINAAHYAYMGARAEHPIYLGEIGRYDDVRFFSTTMCPNGAASTVDPLTGDYVDPGYDPTLDAAGNSNADVYQAAVFGENAYAHAVGLNPEMRDDGITDFGREHALAWYAIWGKKLLTDDSAVIVETT